MFLFCILSTPSAFHSHIPLKSLSSRVAFNFNYNFIMIAKGSFLCHISNGPLLSPVKALSNAHTHTHTRADTLPKALHAGKVHLPSNKLKKFFHLLGKIVQSEGEQQISVRVHSMRKRVQKIWTASAQRAQCAFQLKHFKTAVQVKSGGVKRIAPSK